MHSCCYVFFLAPGPAAAPPTLPDAFPAGAGSVPESGAFRADIPGLGNNLGREFTHPGDLPGLCSRDRLRLLLGPICQYPHIADPCDRASLQMGLVRGQDGLNGANSISAVAGATVPFITH